MCAYCHIGDSWFRHDPPFDKDHWLPQPFQPFKPLIPAPALPQQPIMPWPIEKLREYVDLLKEVKELEDKLGCPCDPDKVDYIALLEARIVEIKKLIPPEGSPETMG